MARTRKQVAQINVVPMIDVMLVLLVVFMITAPFINPGQVALPSVGKTQTTPALPLEVIVAASGEFKLRDRAGDGVARDVSRAELVDEIRRLHRERPDQAVVIAADKDVRYREVMEVMTILQRAQIGRIGLLARPVP